MTDHRPESRPDARLVRLHAERGDPGARLAGALADLEGAGWGLLLQGEAALARELAALLGPGTLRVDPRVRLDREALAAAGLAVASAEGGDWQGARAAVLLEPGEAELERARRAGVPVVVDATLAPGGNWPAQGAAFVLYRDSATLTGHGDAPLCALFGSGRAPQPVGAPPADLAVAVALRDVATLPLRLARAAQTVSTLAGQLGGAAQPAGPTALLLAPDAAPESAAPLGGVVAAARAVPGGVLLTPGLEDARAALALLRGEHRSEPVQERPERPGDRPSERPEPDGRRDFARPAQEERRPGRDRRERGGQGGFRGDRPDRPRPDQPRPDQPRANTSDSGAPQRFTFEAPDSAEETWEPEIVYSDIAQDQVRLPTPVSSGPDAPNLGDLVPDVMHQAIEGQAESGDQEPAAEEAVQQPAPEPQLARQGGRPRTPRAPAATPEVPGPEASAEPDAAAALTPDLPSAPDAAEDPAADLTDEQSAIYARLREWRNAEAKRQQVSRFIVASNATLAEVARRVPYTEADLRAVKGMGVERLRKYGEKILEVVRG